MKWVLVLIGCFWYLAAANGQSASDFPDSILYNLSQQIGNGNRQALRDLGTLLDRPAYSDRSRALLREYIFPDSKSEFLPTEFTRQQFLDYYYRHTEQLQYDPLLRSYLIDDPGHQGGKYRILPSQLSKGNDATVALKRLNDRIRESIARGNYAAARSHLQLAVENPGEETARLLVSLLTDRNWWKSENDAARELAYDLAAMLVDFPDRLTVETLLELTDRGDLPVTATGPLLSRLTNVGFDWRTRPGELTGHYYALLDSFPTIEALQRHGYEGSFEVRPDFFYDYVDYLAYVLALSDDHPWVQHNALRDLLRSDHPRSLYYLAGYLYRIRGSRRGILSATQLVDELEELTGYRVAIFDGKELDDRPDWANNAVARQNFLRYWAAHYDDHEYEPNRGIFVNRREHSLLRQNYERLFRRLNSRNDSVAMHAYLLLTEGEPEAIARLSDKYRELLRNYNRTLPDFRYRYLEQLSKLTHFARRNGIHYDLSPRLSTLFEDLARETEPDLRVRLENDLIGRLTLEHVTAVEYFGLLYPGDVELQFSIGRILDHFYSRAWPELIGDERYLRLYLKKANIFADIGTVGVSNSYLEKFGPIEADLRNELLILRQIESDEDVIEAINVLLGESNPADDDLASETGLLERLPGLNRRELNALSPPTGQQQRELFAFILDAERPSERRAVYNYLGAHPSIDYVPEIFRAMYLNAPPEELVQLLETIYDYPDGTTAAFWIELWEEHSEEYRNWGRMLFERELAVLRNSDTLAISTLNAVLESEFYEPRYRDPVLRAMRRVRPIRELRRLRPDPLLDPQTELHYLDELEFPVRDLDKLTRLFRKESQEDVNALTNYILRKMRDETVVVRGPLYNDLFRLNWFTARVIGNELLPETVSHLWLTLEVYLRESDYLSTYEEQTTLRNIALLSNLSKTLPEQLQSSLTLELDEESRARVQETILSRVSYPELGQVFPYLTELSVLERYNFLMTDFGIPVVDPTDPAVQRDLIATHRELDEREFYEHWLDRFGVGYKKPDGTLDYEAIERILRFDLAIPFVGTGGKLRDYYVYGIIKLLELEHGTRLGFHPKLNENQTFYTYNTGKRIAAWLAYLTEGGFIQKRSVFVPSFTGSVR